MRLAVILLLLLPLGTPARAASPEQEINYLLDFVSGSGCTFIRNGSEHSAVDAADHLRMKYERGRRYADTAEDFIENLASQSSWSGRSYEVICEGQAEASGRWLRRALADYRAVD